MFTGVVFPALSVVLLALIVWMFWNVYPSIPERMLLVGILMATFGLGLMPPEQIRIILGKVLISVAAVLLAVSGLLQFAVPYVVHRITAEVQQVQTDTAERVKETLTPSWFDRFTSR